jgi:hypothetical protein
MPIRGALSHDKKYSCGRVFPPDFNPSYVSCDTFPDNGTVKCQTVVAQMQFRLGHGMLFTTKTTMTV